MSIRYSVPSPEKAESFSKRLNETLAERLSDPAYNTRGVISGVARLLNALADIQVSRLNRQTNSPKDIIS